MVLTAAAVAAAVYAAPEDFRIPLIAGGATAAVLLCAAVTMAVYYRGQVARARDTATAAEARTQEVTATAEARAQARIDSYAAEANALIAELQARIEPLEQALAAKAREAKDSDNRRAAAMAAFAGAAGRMQAMSTSMLAELREMEHRHADPKVLGDLLELDHRTAQAGRLADSIAVLSGARTGRRWAKPIGMESILRGAMGRVAGYQRVRLRAVAEIAIAGHAAEGVMHALAELLDNACNFSPPTTEVHVYAAEVPAGVVITIEDSGLVMSESALRRAESTVSGQGDQSSDLSSLSGTRLGLAVVGHLARKHELTVSYRPSAIGGTAVVVVVPRELTTRLERNTGSLTAVATLPTRPSTDIQRTLTDGLPSRTTASESRELPSRVSASASRELRAVSGTGERRVLPSRTTAAESHHELPSRTDTGENLALPSRAETRDSRELPSGAAAGEYRELPAGAAADENRALPSGPVAGENRETPVRAGYSDMAQGAAVSPALSSADTGLSESAQALFGTPPPLADLDPAHSAYPPSADIASVSGQSADTPASTGSGLPKRRRGSTLAAVHPDGLSAPGTPQPLSSFRPPSPSNMGAFQRAMNGGENGGTATPSPSAPLENDR
ncbi:sensor histidine kinase [Nocardia sp. IFM 10818]